MEKISIILALFTLAITSCTSFKSSLETPLNVLVNQVMTDKNDKPQLIGVTTTEGLKQAPFQTWFDENYNSYSVDNEIVSKCKKEAKDIEVLAFMGTWCGDSKREVPRFYKVMDELNIAENRVKLINLYADRARYKQGPNREEKGLNIHRVPTFIFYKNGTEIGRIVESPKTSMETDIAQILTGLASPPRYEIVDELNQEFTNNQHETVKEKYEDWGKLTARNTTSLSELNTYGYVLAAQGKMEEAIIAFTINTLAYPKEHYTFNSLARAYQKLEKNDLAIENFEKALALKPDFETAQKALAELTK